MSIAPDDTTDPTIDVNLDSTRDDIKPLLDQINPLLKQVIDIVRKYPDETAECPPGATFSKILFSRIPGTP